jgi:hypothetical protein
MLGVRVQGSSFAKATADWSGFRVQGSGLGVQFLTTKNSKNTKKKNWTLDVERWMFDVEF